MIVNGVKSTLTQSSAASLGMGVSMAGIALAADALMIAAPAVAGAAIAAGMIVASAKIYGFVRDSIFKNRVEDLESYAKKLGVNPNLVNVSAVQVYEGGNQDITNRLSTLIHDRDLVKWSNDSIGSSCDYKRISRESVAEAKECMQMMAGLSAQPVSLLQTLKGGSQVMLDIAAHKTDLRGFFSEDRQQEMRDENEMTSCCPRP